LFSVSNLHRPTAGQPAYAIVKASDVMLAID
jgi:molybdopterin-binding protein